MTAANDTTPPRAPLAAQDASRLLRHPSRIPDDTLFVSELFGPTIQGEGAHAGQAATFLRLAACPLMCSWCDTKYAWDPRLATSDNPFHLTTAETAAADIAAFGSPRLVVTGGEPLLQRTQITALTERLTEYDIAVEVETAGVISPGALASTANLITVSPKLANSGMPIHRRLRWPILHEFAATNSVFKFVVVTRDDLHEVSGIVNRLGLGPQRVFVSAEGTTAGEHLRLARSIAGDVVARGWGLSTRWHLLLWDDERGR